MCRLVFRTRTALSLQVEIYRSYRTEHRGVVWEAPTQCNFFSAFCVDFYFVRQNLAMPTHTN